MAGWLLSTAMGVSAAAAAFGAPAMAEEYNANDDAPITVIGQRQRGERNDARVPAPLLDTPQTVQVIPAEVFNQQGARDLTEVLRNTPGITFEAGENGFATGLSNFSMRGFDTSSNIFVDGARDSGSYSRDAFNVEQVEVVKGPAGEFGRGGAGGYVNIVTKTPTSDTAYSIGASYGFDDYDSDDRVRVTADLNQPLSQSAAARLNLLWEDGGAPGRAVAGRNTFGFAPSLALGLGEQTRFVASAQYVSQNDTPDYGVPVALVSGMFRHDPNIDGESLRDVYYGLASDYDDTESAVALGRFERTLSPNWELSSQLRWSQTERETFFTVASGYASATQLVTTQVYSYARDNEGLSWLTNVSGRFNTGPLRHSLAAGVEWSTEEAQARAFSVITNPGTGVPTPVANPNPNRAGFTALAPTELSTVDVTTVAAYVFDSIELSPQWLLTAGLRVESYEVGISSVNAVTGAPAAANGLEISETTWSGRIGISYKPVENATIYAAAGVAPQPPASFLSTSDISRGGANAFPGFDTGMNSAGSKVQESVNYELGVKWDLLDRRLNLTAALFRTERQNVAISGRTGTLASDPIVLMGYGEQVVQGLEIGLAGQITENWSIFAGALFMESERNHSAALDVGRCRAQPGDYGLAATDAGRAACDAALHGTSGDALAFTPEVSASLWTTYTLPFGFTIGGGVRYVGETWVGRPDTAERIIPNGAAGELPSYWVANALVEYQVTPQARLRLNVDNITDEFYAVSTNWAAQRAMLGAGRSFLLSVNYSF